MFVVVDNRGGGIFSFLPQAGLPEHFETLWGTPHHLDLVALCAVHGIPAVRVGAGVRPGPGGDRPPSTAGGVRVVVVPTEREANVAHHRGAHQAVAEALAAAG